MSRALRSLNETMDAFHDIYEELCFRFVKLQKENEELEDRLYQLEEKLTSQRDHYATQINKMIVSSKCQ